MVARASGAAQRAEIATTASCSSARAAVDRNGLGVSTSPLSRQDDQGPAEAPRGQRNASTEYYELSDKDEVPARGSPPPCLGEPRVPQDRDQQRTVEQTADHAPHGTDFGSSCGADGRPAGGRPQAVRFPGSRAGYRMRYVPLR